MKEALKIHVDMFKPDYGGSRTAREGFEGLIGILYGESARQVITNSLAIEDFASAEANQHYFTSTARLFGLKSEDAARTKFAEGWRNTVATIRDLSRLAGFLESNTRLRDELSFPSKDPDKLLKFLRRDDGSNSLGWQTRRQILLNVISNQLDAISGNGETEDMIFNAIGALDTNLYVDGEEGNNEEHFCFSAHGIKENELIGISQSSTNFLGNGRVYRDAYSSRQLEGGLGYVYTNPRTKNAVSSIEKAIAKALVGNGEIDPESVKDFMGLKAVVLEDHSKQYVEDDEMKRCNLIHDAYINALASKWHIEQTPDDSVDLSRGQAPIKWRRSILKIDDFPVSIELVICPERQHLMQSRHVGKKNSAGLFDGEAHKLFQIRRNTPVAMLVLSGIGVSSDLILRGIVQNSFNTAEELKIASNVVRTTDEHKGYI